MSPAPALAGGECDVAVIGAGCAGLAAATHLRAAGRSVCLLDASTAPGGRCQTVTSAILHHAPFDTGAQWFHASEHNTLLQEVQKSGILTRPDLAQGFNKILYDDTLSAQNAELYDAASALWLQTISARLSEPDISIREAAGSLIEHNPLAATVQAFQANLIAAAPEDELSLHDWHALRLLGSNVTAPDGLGAAIARTLTPPAGAIHLNTIATTIDATAAGYVKITTNRGTIRAKSVIVTVSIGVLQSGSIAFTPALPQPILAALGGLRMGNMTKIALLAAGPDRLDCAPGTDAVRRVAANQGAGLFTVMWPNAHPYVTAFAGARLAQSLDSMSIGDAAAFVRDDLAAIFGAGARTLFCGPALRTDWAQNQFSRGAYAYARPGHAGARENLCTPIWDGRLLLAGEANAPANLAGTADGAFRAGIAAARKNLFIFKNLGPALGAHGRLGIG